MEVPTGRGAAAAAAAAGSLATKVPNKKQRRQKQANALLLILCLLQLYHWPCSCDQLQQTNQATPSNELPDEELDNSIGLHRDVGRVESQPGGVSGEGGETKQEAVVANRRIERRLDKLEFELRKSLHLMRMANLANSDDQRQAPEVNETLLDSRWSSLAGRLELMEKFIAIAAAKLFETELRVKQLEKCDCKLSCKWNYQPNNQTTARSLSKADGQVWRDKCDVCSCHRGSVRCKHVTCPKLKCSQAHHVPGKCCPVCYKPCVYKSQTVKHGNKLVINSNKDSCKECMCMDGRLKCQRVELLGQPQEQQDQPSQLAATQPEPQLQLQRLQRSSLIDFPKIGEEQDSYNDYDEDPSRLKRHLEALVCPQVDCALEDQLRLRNDCCTYCRKFDFCNHPVAQLSCHLSATCINTLMFQTTRSNLSELDNTIESMFRCSCRSGFRGDGRHCDDVDECADRKLNDCDPKTTTCVNLPGGYECRCKRGFRPLSWAPSPPNLELSEGNDESRLMNLTLPALGAPRALSLTRECADLDECAAGNQNRCHPQANCLNKRGGYKCTCKPGFLGNGLECHKWFSSEPSVAAYLYRHSSRNQTTLSSNSPLNSLDEEDEQLAREQDPVPKVKADRQAEEELEDDEDEEEEEELDDEDPLEDEEPKLAGPELSQSKWEPLHFDWSLGFQQTYQPAAVVVTNQTDGAGADNETGSGQDQNSAQQQLQSLSLNTRTMFFQPPPLPEVPGSWGENVTEQNSRPKVELQEEPGSSNNQASPDEARTTLQVDRPTGAAGKSDITSSSTSTTTTTNNNIDQGKQSDLPSRPALSNGNGSSGNANNNNNGPAGYKRGVIIASATTTPIKNGKAYSSQYYRNRTPSGAGSSAPSAYSNIRIVYIITLALVSTVNQFILFRQQEYF